MVKDPTYNTLYISRLYNNAPAPYFSDLKYKQRWSLTSRHKHNCHSPLSSSVDKMFAELMALMINLMLTTVRNVN